MLSPSVLELDILQYCIFSLLKYIKSLIGLSNGNCWNELIKILNNLASLIKYDNYSTSKALKSLINTF